MVTTNQPSVNACGSQTSAADPTPALPCSRLLRTAALATLVGLALAISSAAPAEAARQWVIGTSERSTVLNCTSVVIGEPYAEPGLTADAAWFVDKRKLPRVGEVFYVRTFFGAVGRPCVEQTAAVEVVLPRGGKARDLASRVPLSSLAVAQRAPEKCRSRLAEAHARAAVPDDLAENDRSPTDGLAVPGATLRTDSESRLGVYATATSISRTLD